ncbi:uncharacterized protein LOC111320104 [Stylophora pistillata]|uniref:uncharacterized protein LOC111320104 n=1 Tax=Stylophora pistillata TaxID=50429 RepID=UPI000C04F8C4|nr:uncharacterized protein LOC111320104 [Stylophora pistillata]
MSLLATAEIETPIIESPFHTIKNLCASDLQEVNNVLLEQVQGTLPFITQLANHLIQSGGKRLRPLLTLASAMMCDYQGKNHIPLAACIEMIHTATLLHDDVVDDSQKRRNNASANALWGNSASVLVGDFLFSKSFVLMVNYGSKEILKTLSKTASIIAEGEVYQLTQLTEPTDSVDVYLDIIQRKTACLFAAACRTGGLVAEVSETIIKALENYGHNLGLAFQITDDLLDYSACESTLGKTVGDDFKEGKITLPSILAFKKATPEEKSFWIRTLGEKQQQAGDFEKAVSIIHKHQSHKESLALAQEYAEKAQEALNVVPTSELKSCLQELALYCVNRSF